MKSLKGKKFLVTIFATIFLLNISDVYDRTDTIMYGMTPYVRGLTKDFNDVLVNKYR